MRTEESQLNQIPHGGWNISLWIVQILLALAFGFGGFSKLTFPMEQLKAQMVWPGDIPASLVRFIGACELLASIGLILPALTKIRPILTPLAAAALALIMLFAMIFHFTRGEYGAIAVNVGFGVFALFVAWGRIKKAPIG